MFSAYSAASSVSTLKLGFNPATYLRDTMDFMQAMDVTLHW